MLTKLPGPRSAVYFCSPSAKPAHDGGSWIRGIRGSLSAWKNGRHEQRRRGRAAGGDRCREAPSRHQVHRGRARHEDAGLAGARGGRHLYRRERPGDGVVGWRELLRQAGRDDDGRVLRNHGGVLLRCRLRRDLRRLSRGMVDDDTYAADGVGGVPDLPDLRQAGDGHHVSYTRLSTQRRSGQNSRFSTDTSLASWSARHWWNALRSDSPNISSVERYVSSCSTPGAIE